MQIIQGIPAAPGIAIGPGFQHVSKPIATEQVSIQDPAAEIERLQEAVDRSEVQLVDIYEAARKTVGEETAEIFQAHRMMLKDPELLDAVRQAITTKKMNAEAAFHQASESYAELLQNLADEYLQARAVDVRDVAARVIRNLRNEAPNAASLTSPAIIFAEDLTPSDTIHYERNKLLGFFTVQGGATSHTAILSRALGIPAVVGGESMPEITTSGQVFILDGERGRLIVDPDHDTLEEYLTLQISHLARLNREKAAALAPAITLDGKHVEIVANIGNLEDAKSAVLNGAEGVGLFRTEFSYLEQSSIPDEKALVDIYRAIFRTFGNLPVVVRTLDIGGDKEVPHLGLPGEANPFLGHRGIRFCLSRPDLFKPQLRAILRAGSQTNLHIMFPMVSVLEEVLEARRVLSECKAELERESVDFNRDPKIGIMVEVPAAALCADQLAKEVDFFSIGTNDLTQYTLAADRTNAKVAHLANSLQPAVLRLIKQIIDQGHNAGIKVGMCGEMAGDPTAIPILLGLGLDELSMNPNAIPQAKAILRNWDSHQAADLAQQALECATPEEIQQIVLI